MSECDELDADKRIALALDMRKAFAAEGKEFVEHLESLKPDDQ